MKRILFPTLLIATFSQAALLPLPSGVRLPPLWRISVKDAKKYYEDKDYATATIQLLRAVQQDPRNREARFLLVDSYMSQSDVNSAGRQLISFLEYFPEDREASLKLGNLYLRDPRLYEEIRKITVKLLQKNPDDVEALILQGNVNAGLRKLPDSKESFERATALDPNNPSALIGLGTTQALQQNFPEAEKAFLKARSSIRRTWAPFYRWLTFIWR